MFPLWRQWGFYRYQVTSMRMSESYPMGMEIHPVSTLASVEPVAYYRHTESFRMGAVHTELMGSAGKRE